MSKNKNLRKALKDEYLDEDDILDDYPRNDQTDNCEVFRGKRTGPRRGDY